jgi:hypothetical protein
MTQLRNSDQENISGSRKEKIRPLISRIPAIGSRSMDRLIFHPPSVVQSVGFSQADYITVK